MTDPYDTSGYYAALFGALAVYFLIFAVAYVVTSILLSAMFKKAGIDGWKAWVPILNNYTLLEMGGQKGWYIFLAFVPFVGSIIVLVFMIMAFIEINKRFRQSTGMLVLAILLSPVYYGIVGYSQTIQWYGPRGGVGPAQPQFAGGYAAPAPVAAYGAPAPVPAAPGYPAYGQAPAAPVAPPYATAPSVPAADPFGDAYNAPAAPAAPVVHEGVAAADANIAAGGLTAVVADDLSPYAALNVQAKADNVTDARALVTSIAGAFNQRTPSSNPLLIVVDGSLATDPEIAAGLSYVNTYGAQVNARTLVVSASSPTPPAAPPAPGNAWN